MFTFHNHLIDRITLNLNHGFVVLLNTMEKPIQTYTHILLLMVKKNTLCVLIDLSKAFECVHHNIIKSMYLIILIFKILANIG